MERCERFEELLSQRLDQPLPPQEERELEDHLAHCPSCRALAADLEQLCGQFACLEELPAPEGFAQGVMDRIRALEPEPAPAETPEGLNDQEEKTEQAEENVIPLRRRMPRWARTAAALAACCVLGFGVYQAGLLNNASPADQTGESADASGGVAAYAAVPGEGTSGAAATLPTPEEGQRPVYDDWAQEDQNTSAGTQKEDAASTQKRSAQAPAHSQTVPDDQPVTMPPSLSDAQNAIGDTGGTSGNTESVVGSQAIPAAPQNGNLTLPQLPQGAEEILTDQTQWTDNGDGTRSCTVTADQAQRLLDLARDQGMDCPEVETETTGEGTMVLTVPNEE